MTDVTQELITQLRSGDHVGEMTTLGGVVHDVKCLMAADWIVAARDALQMWETLYVNVSMKSGVCCCGDDMENHENPMNCGHSPLDSGEYYAALAIDKTRVALSTIEPFNPNPTQTKPENDNADHF